MPLQLRATRLPLDQIDLNDDTFALTIDGVPTSNPELEASIAENGIMHPPIVQEKASGSYRVVAGFKRLRAVVATRTVCDCLVLAANTGPAESLAAAFAETQLNREPTALEKAVFLDKSLRWLDEEQVAERFLPKLGIRAGVPQLKQFLKLLELEEPLLLAVHAGKLDETVARELVELPFGDRMALFDLIDLLSLSVGNQKKLVAGCRELAGRNDTSIINILDDQGLRDILGHEASNLPQKAGHLMNWLSKLRSPRLDAAEKEFHAFRGKLALPKGVNLRHAQSFEKDSVTLEVEFPSRQELEQRWMDLREILVGDKQR
ncbi:MAG: ParB/Srx family N-terminal domain-containing protein, partial [Desulfobulbaceae bacterium]|nr:ParB/Srx family N-terminal domain-containing protein [Desulfobulbaceae bacterium]